jgi:transcriptional regulator with XRE-family HTH domain
MCFNMVLKTHITWKVPSMSSRPTPDRPLYAGEVFSVRLREIRERRGWSQTELAERLDDYGRPFQRTTITKLETPGHQQARNVKLEDVLAIAAVLGVAPVHLFIPLEDDVRVRLFEKSVRDDKGNVTDLGVLLARVAREWVRGRGMVMDTNHRLFWSEMPEHEREAMRLQSEESAHETGVGEPIGPEFFDPSRQKAGER